MQLMGRITVKDPSGTVVAAGLDYTQARQVRRQHPGSVLVDEAGDEVGVGGRPVTGERKGYPVLALPSEWALIDAAAERAGKPSAAWLRAAVVGAAVEIKRLAGFARSDVVPEDRRLPVGRGVSRTRGERRISRILRAHEEEWRQIEEAAALLGQTPRRWLRDVALAEAARP